MAARESAVMDAVQGGMEILSWEYSPDQRLPRAVDRLVSIERPGGSLAVVAGAYGMFLVAGAAVAFGAPTLVGGALALAGAALFPIGPELLRRWRYSRRPTQGSGRTRVHITSTGVAFGPYARLWNGEEERLTHAWIRRRTWTSLQLEFTGDVGRRTQMNIPIPAHLEVGVIEVLALLKAKIEGTTTPGEHNMRLARAKRKTR